jgi:processive 1,2-diacylglycerol beta-glucosyltransferase
MRKIILVVQDAGSGHRSTANVLKEKIAEADESISVSIVNVHREIIGYGNENKPSLPVLGEEIYNFLVRRGFIPGIRLAYWFFKALGKFANRGNLIRVEKYLAHHRPDAIVSLMPWVNDHLFDVAKKLNIRRGIVITDFTPETLPWTNEIVLENAEFIYSPNEYSTGYLRGKGYPGERIVQGSFPIVHRKFFSERDGNEGFDIGLKPGLFSVAIMMGGYGGRQALKAALEIDKISVPMNVVMCCGNNASLMESIKRLSGRSRHNLIALGYIDYIEKILGIADLYITKPGPASITEAILSEVPVLLIDKDVLPQEIGYLNHLKGNGLCLHVKDYADLAGEVAKHISHSGNLDGLRGKYRAIASAADIGMEHESLARRIISMAKAMPAD